MKGMKNLPFLRISLCGPSDSAVRSNPKKILPFHPRSFTSICGSFLFQQIRIIREIRG
jgi:hypothetical protein